MKKAALNTFEFYCRCSAEHDIEHVLYTCGLIREARQDWLAKCTAMDESFQASWAYLKCVLFGLCSSDQESLNTDIALTKLTCDFLYAALNATWNNLWIPNQAAGDSSQLD